MKLKVFSVYDSKVAAYMPPFFMRTKGEAIRAFMAVCEDEKTQFSAHPEDFVLFELGEFDDESGKIYCDLPVSVGSALEFVSRLRVERDQRSNKVVDAGAGERNLD